MAISGVFVFSHETPWWQRLLSVALATIGLFLLRR
jgi:hypothetical protein